MFAEQSQRKERKEKGKKKEIISRGTYTEVSRTLADLFFFFPSSPSPPLPSSPFRVRRVQATRKLLPAPRDGDSSPAEDIKSIVGKKMSDVVGAVRERVASTQVCERYAEDDRIQEDREGRWVKKRDHGRED